MRSQIKWILIGATVWTALALMLLLVFVGMLALLSDFRLFGELRFDDTVFYVLPTLFASFGAIRGLALGLIEARIQERQAHFRLAVASFTLASALTAAGTLPFLDRIADDALFVLVPVEIVLLTLGLYYLGRDALKCGTLLPK
jgi:hypothetical protein